MFFFTSMNKSRQMIFLTVFYGTASLRPLSAVYNVNPLEKSSSHFRRPNMRAGFPALYPHCLTQPLHDAPFERRTYLSDHLRRAIRDAGLGDQERLKPHCMVFSRRRGTLQGYSLISNGNRHYRVALKRSVPCYMRFGRHLLRFYHDHHVKTCRKCGSANHLARDCTNTVCFNCDQLGHMSKDCPNGTLCCIFKHVDHMAIDCPLSWYRRPTLDRDEP